MERTTYCCNQGYNNIIRKEIEESEVIPKVNKIDVNNS